MRYTVMAVFDRKAEVFSQPHYSVSKGASIRGFADEVNRKDEANMLNKHPEDFDLYFIGYFDDSTGAFECAGAPVRVSQGTDFSES